MRGEHVGGAHELDGEGLADVPLLQLAARDARGPPVGDRGGHDHDVGGGRLAPHRGEQLLRGAHGHHLDAHGRRDLEVRRDQDDLRSAVARGLGEPDALPAARGVAEEADRVERLARAAGGDEHPAAVEPAGRCGVDRAVELRVRARPRRRGRPRRCRRAPPSDRPRRPCRSAARSTGPTRSTPRDSRVRTLACVAACSHISVCIAGATTSGAALARTVVPSRSSARPVASFASVFAVAGAMTIRSADWPSATWRTSATPS